MMTKPEKLRLLIDKLAGEEHLVKYSNEDQARIIHRLLQKVGVDHWLMEGELHIGERTIESHFWNECDGLTIDYSLRAQFGNLDEIPHGVFVESGQFLYEGAEVAPSKPQPRASQQGVSGTI